MKTYINRSMPHYQKFKLRLNSDKLFRFRTIAVSLSILLSIWAVLLCLSLVNALFGAGKFPAGFSYLFSRPFGLLALLIPAYLVYAAFTLADPRWKPQRIFTLSVSIVPFITLALGFSLTKYFDYNAQRYAFLNFTGKTGFNLLIIFITVIEVFFLGYVKNKLFNVARNPENTGKRTALLPAPDYGMSHDELSGENDSMTDDQVSINIDNSISIDNSVNTNNSVDTDNSEIIDNIDEEEFVADVQDNESLERALEEAEAAAVIIQNEQARKKASRNLRTKKYKVPVDILTDYPDGEYWVIDQATKDAAIALKETLEEFKIKAEVTGIRKGPVITMIEILPAPGVKLSRIVGLQDNIALRLAAASVRIVAPIPGKHAVGIEIPNEKRNIVSFREIIEGELERESNKMEIPVVIGKDITGEAQTIDLVQTPHLLIAGATGSGKSVCVNSMILSILYQLHPADCRLMLIDPKIVELKLYNDIPHLLTPVITEPKKAFQALQYCIYEMERRYACLDSMGVRDIRNYNKRIKEKNIAQEPMPYIVVVIDEFADLMSTTGKELESTVARLCAMSRAVGIHLVLATQRPSIDVITGLIKANIPSRIAFMVASKTDSRIIIDAIGAEKLLGKGDMLYQGIVDAFPIRMQGAFISEEEVESVVEYVKSFGEPDYIDDEIFFEEEEENTGASLFSDGDDPLYDKALEIVMQQGKASASYIQRRLKIGFNRAARLVDEMEQHGVVGPANGSKPRDLLRGLGI